MRRRHVLASVTALLAAGCLGAKRPESASAVRTEGSTNQLSTQTPTPTPEPTETPTPEPTETPESTATETPEPADAERGEAALETAREALREAAETFADDADLTGVSATTTGFDARTMLLSLDDAQRALAAADDDVTDGQRDQLAALRTAERFLTRATLAQSYLVDTYRELRTLEAAVTTDLDTAEAAENSFDATLETVNDPIQTLKNDIDADAVDAADVLDADAYEEKLDQFDAERSVFRTVSAGLNRLVDGMGELEEAREEEDEGNDDEAADHADEARDLFDEAYEKFDTAVEDATTDPLEETVDGLVDVADAKYRDADDLHADTT